MCTFYAFLVYFIVFDILRTLYIYLYIKFSLFVYMLVPFLRRCANIFLARLSYARWREETVWFVLPLRLSKTLRACPELTS